MKTGHGRLVGNLVLATAITAATFTTHAQTITDAGSGDIIKALPISLHRTTAVDGGPGFEMQWDRSSPRTDGVNARMQGGLPARTPIRPIEPANERTRIRVSERDCQQGYGQLALIKLGGDVTFHHDWARNGPAALDRMAAETCAAGLAMKPA